MDLDETRKEVSIDTLITLLVNFHNDDPFYSPQSDLWCLFSFKDDFEVDDLSECSVSLFKVGWENSQDYIATRTLDTCDVLSDQNSGARHFENGEVYKVKFSCNELPHAGAECYQFCFLWQHSVLGASKPFQIQEGESSETEASDIEIIKEGDLEWWYETSTKQTQDLESEEVVIIDNEKTVLEETLSRVMEENTVLKRWQKETEAEMDSNKEYTADIEDQKATLEKIVMEKAKQIALDAEVIAELETRVVDWELKCQHMEEKDAHMEQHIEMLKRQLSESDKEIKSLMNRIEVEEGEEKSKITQMYEVKVKNLKEICQDMERELAEKKVEKDMLTTKYFEEGEEYRKVIQDMLTKIEKCEDKIIELNVEKEDLISKALEDKDRADISLKERDVVVENLRTQVNEVSELNSKLCIESEKKISEVTNEMEVLRKDLDSSEEIRKALMNQLCLIKDGSDKVNSLRLELENLRSSEAAHEIALKDTKVDLEKERKECKELRDKYLKSNGARHALKVAYAHVQQQYTVIKAEKEEITRLLHSLKRQLGGTPSSSIIEDQNKQIEDLKLRLCMGLNVYKEKFVECRKLQSKLQKIQESASSELSGGTSGIDMPWNSFNAALKATLPSSAPDVTDVGKRYNCNGATLKEENVELRKENAKLLERISALQKEESAPKPQVTEDDQSKSKSSPVDTVGSQGSSSLIDSCKEKKIIIELASEVRRLEDSLQAKDSELRKLKANLREMEKIIELPAAVTPLELKEIHDLKMEKLQKECDEYKKILTGASKVVHEKLFTSEGHSQEDDFQEEELVKTKYNEIRRPPGFESRKQQEKNVEEEVLTPRDSESTFRSWKFPPEVPGKKADVAAVKQVKDTGAKRNPKNSDKKGKVGIITKTSFSRNFQYPWIYGQTRTTPPQVPGNVLRRSPVELVGGANQAVYSKNRSLRDLMEPIEKCPVCQMVFSSNITPFDATEHVNGHFERQ